MKNHEVMDMKRVVINVPFSYTFFFPVNTRRRFNVDTTSFQCQYDFVWCRTTLCDIVRRRINVEATLCVCRVALFGKFIYKDENESYPMATRNIRFTNKITACQKLVLKLFLLMLVVNWLVLCLAKGFCYKFFEICL